MNVLTVGNVAKLYCLNWIEQHALEKGGKIDILDLGCGTSTNFVNLLKLYPRTKYVGIEPSKEYCLRARHHLSGLNATIINSYAYHLYDKLQEKFDIVVSFSVLEHVYRRLDYLRSAKECLRHDGFFLINYDAGHFVYGKERLNTIIGQLFAHFGIEKCYQSFVKEQDFLEMAERVGFRILEAKFFNSNLKGTFKVIPKSHRPEYMKKWLDYELWLNELGIEYDDSKTRFFGTRNFILAHR